MLNYIIKNLEIGDNYSFILLFYLKIVQKNNLIYFLFRSFLYDTIKLFV